MNKSQQGKVITLILVKYILCVFKFKLKLYVNNIEKGEYCNFMRLKTFEKELSLDEKMRYIPHMNNLIRNIDCRFYDIFPLNIPDFIIDPFNCNISEIDRSIQEDILDIQNDSELKNISKIKDITNFG